MKLTCFWRNQYFFFHSHFFFFDKLHCDVFSQLFEDVNGTGIQYTMWNIELKLSDYLNQLSITNNCNIFTTVLWYSTPLQVLQLFGPFTVNKQRKWGCFGLNTFQRDTICWISFVWDGEKNQMSHVKQS